VKAQEESDYGKAASIGIGRQGKVRKKVRKFGKQKVKKITNLNLFSETWSQVEVKKITNLNLFSETWSQVAKLL
jgi:hypothetical protein